MATLNKTSLKIDEKINRLRAIRDVSTNIENMIEWWSTDVKKDDDFNIIEYTPLSSYEEHLQIVKEILEFLAKKI